MDSVSRHCCCCTCNCCSATVIVYMPSNHVLAMLKALACHTVLTCCHCYARHEIAVHSLRARH
jgi:hypothetical protein